MYKGLELILFRKREVFSLIGCFVLDFINAKAGTVKNRRLRFYFVYLFS